MDVQALTIDPTPADDPDLTGAEHPPVDPSVHEFTVPRSEYVTVPGLIVAEVFPPSEAMQLQKALVRLRCRDRRNLLRGDDHQIPAGTASAWWRLAAIGAAGGMSTMPAGQDRHLPVEFAEIELGAARIGEGFCAVVATFHPTDAARRRVDDIWHRNHHHDASGLAAQRLTHNARRSLHDAARRWLAAELPGFFAANDQPQPLIEVMLVDRPAAPGGTHSPTGPTGPGPLAMNLERTSPCRDRRPDAARTWTLWGDRRDIDAALAPSTTTDDGTIVRCVARTSRDHLVRLAISEQLSVYLARYARMRDHAHSRAGFVRIKHLEDQRDNLLSLSLNISTIDRAVRAYNENYRRRCASSHDIAAQQLTTDQRDMLDQLKEADEQYRTILPVSASLASSMQALRASRIARWIASMSLVVSLLLLALADTATSPRIATLLQWLTSR